jgi:hypothetical protein
MKTDQEKIERRAAEIPPLYRSKYLKAMKGRSLRAAIDAMCMECVAWQRVEITKCSSQACPLYPYRPYQHD